MSAGNFGVIAGHRLLAPVSADACGEVFRVAWQGSAPQGSGQQRLLRVLRLDANAIGFAEHLAVQGQALQAVVHPGLAGVLNFGIDAGRAWLASRLVEGQTLAPGERRPDAEALAIAGATAAALDYAHRHRLVHGDLAPSQILVSAGGPVNGTVLLNLGVIPIVGRTVPNPLC